MGDLLLREPSPARPILVHLGEHGNSDAHLKNFSLLYNQAWTERRLAPLYDVTSIPLTGYSTAMPFDIGYHRALDDIDERDITILASDLDIGLGAYDQVVKNVTTAFDSPSLGSLDKNTERMIGRILENASQRIEVLKMFLGSN